MSAASFWIMAHKVASLSEGQRLACIQAGFPARWLPATREAFALDNSTLSRLANFSPASLGRRLKDGRPLDPVASERLDRLAQLAVMAESVFEDKTVAAAWLVTANDALGRKSPLVLCETELGGRQARRALHGVEWGGVV